MMDLTDMGPGVFHDLVPGLMLILVLGLPDDILMRRKFLDVLVFVLSLHKQHN